MEALDKTQAGADLGLHHPVNPGASAYSGQLQNTSEHYHLVHAQLADPAQVGIGDQWSQPILASDWPG